IIHIIIYMSIGIIGYSFLLNTKWSIIDSMYFSTVIFTTVGYGDITPDDSASGMLFTIFYAFYGIIIIGIFLGILGDVSSYFPYHIVSAIDDLIIVTAAGSADNIDDDDDDESLLNEEKNVTILTDICTICREQFRYMIVLIIIAIPITILERWSVTKGLYWMIISATTIGLGDEHPEQPWSRLICIIYIPLLVAFCGSLLGKIATSYVDKRNDILESQFFNRAVTESDLKSMDLDHSGKVSKDEFLIYMLLTLQKVDKTDIEDIMDLFKKLDKDGSGTLAVNDI
ncbi:Ion_trans_2-domain-containing protein, partial [Fragilariopsis cylindrus CCMP1102]